jgi:TfoX/Sxy family transcriptional regulator of competence genes
MAYNEQLSDRIHQALASVKNLEVKKMFGGVCFMVNDKMCVGVMKDEMMCRIDPDLRDELMEKDGCHQMDFGGRPMKGILLVNEYGMKTKKEFDYWIDLCLAWNPKARSSKKKK